MTAEQFYKQLLRDIEVPMPEIEDVRDDRQRVARTALQLLAEWGLSGRRWFPAGALSMGTQIWPLNDFDLVVEVSSIPEGWRSKPQYPLEQLCAGLGRVLDVRCVVTTHAVRLEIRDESYTGDVVFGVSRLGGGIELPHCPSDERHKWIESHPEAHARLVRRRNKEIGYEFAREVRILKQLNRRWGMQASDERKPLSSWHLTALALAILDKPFSHATGTPLFLREAANRVLRPLPDPSGVGEALEARDPQQAAQLLAAAAERTAEAAAAGDRGGEILEDVFGDAAVLRTAVTGGPIAVAAGGAFTVGAGRSVHTATRGHGDARW